MNSKTISLDELRRLCGQRDGPPTCQHCRDGTRIPCGQPAKYVCDDGGEKDRPRFVCRDHLQYQVACIGRVLWPPPPIPEAAFDSEGPSSTSKANQRGRAEETAWHSSWPAR